MSFRNSGSRASLSSSRESGAHDVFMPDGRIQRASPIVVDEHQAFLEDVDDPWWKTLISLCKEIYDSVFSVHAVKLTGVLVLLILCGTVETINYSANGQRFMAQYLTTLNVLVVLGATIFFFAIVAVKLATDHDYYTDEATWVWRGEHCGWFFKNIIMMALMDTISLYMGILASHSVTAPLRTLLQQASIPMTMVVSFLFLRRRYKIVHIVGAVLIVVGIVLSMYQIITKGNPGEKKSDHDVQSSDSSWTVVFFLSCIPMAVSSCLKEYVLTHRQHAPDMNQVNAWVAGCQLVMGCAISPLSYICANLGVNSAIPPMSQFPSNMADGFKCGVWGDATACNAQCFYVNGNTTDCSGIPGEKCDCGLSMAPASVWLYVAVCCCFNLMMLYVIKEGTAVLFWMSSAAIIPVVAIISSTQVYEWLNLGKVAFSVMQICGLVLVVSGIAVYRSQAEENPTTLDLDGLPIEDAYDGTRAEIYNSIKDHMIGEERQSVNTMGTTPRGWRSSASRGSDWGRSSTGSPRTGASHPGHPSRSPARGTHPAC